MVTYSDIGTAGDRTGSVQGFVEPGEQSVKSDGKTSSSTKEDQEPQLGQRPRYLGEL